MRRYVQNIALFEETSIPLKLGVLLFLILSNSTSLLFQSLSSSPLCFSLAVLMYLNEEMLAVLFKRCLTFALNLITALGLHFWPHFYAGEKRKNVFHQVYFPKTVWLSLLIKIVL